MEKITKKQLKDAMDNARENVSLVNTLEVGAMVIAKITQDIAETDGSEEWLEENRDAMEAFKDASLTYVRVLTAMKMGIDMEGIE